MGLGRELCNKMNHLIVILKTVKGKLSFSAGYP